MFMTTWRCDGSGEPSTACGSRQASCCRVVAAEAIQAGCAACDRVRVVPRRLGRVVSPRGGARSSTIFAGLRVAIAGSRAASLHHYLVQLGWNSLTPTTSCTGWKRRARCRVRAGPPVRG